MTYLSGFMLWKLRLALVPCVPLGLGADFTRDTEKRKVKAGIGRDWDFWWCNITQLLFPTCNFVRVVLNQSFHMKTLTKKRTTWIDEKQNLWIVLT